MIVFTVATVSYLYQVEVLFSSLRRVHPECQLALILSDCSEQMLSRIRGRLDCDVDVLCCQDLHVADLEIMRQYYGPLEFCSALKVLGARYFLKKTEKSCLFLDPDMVVFDRLDEVIFNREAEIVVSAHSQSPYPVDGEAPNDLEPCFAGYINGGLLLTRRTNRGMQALDWLASKARFQWFVAPMYGMYADQQWLSALPYYFRKSADVVEDKGVNVAYWNLHERPLRVAENGAIVLCEGSSLKLFHFSGFPPPQMEGLTIHSARRFDDQTELLVRGLVEKYRTELTRARAKYSGLQGDLPFCRSRLRTKLRIAERYWGPAANPGKSPSIGALVKKGLRKIRYFGSKW